MSDSRNKSEQEERDARDLSATAEERNRGRGERRPGGGPEQQKSTASGADGSTYQEADRQELVAALSERDEQIRQLEQELADREHELTELKDSNLRKAAEMENFRKRVQRDRAQIYESAKANALEDFLSVNDDLRRTLKASEDLNVPDTFLDGVTLVAEKFGEVLNKHGVERIDQEMVPFDVDLHDAMMRQKPQDEEIESDMVLQVIENGYRIGDRTIRHAKVIVSE